VNALFYEARLFRRPRAQVLTSTARRSIASIQQVVVQNRKTGIS
jgi:hypothetical protein